MKTNRALLAFAGSIVILLSVSSGVRAQDAQQPLPPPPSDAIYVQRGVAVADGDVGPGPMMHEGIGFLGFEAGLGEKTITGAPFSANFSTESTQTLADGNQIQHSSTGSIARDSQGRTRREMTLPAIGAFAVVNGETLSHVVFLKDPVANTRYVLEEDKKIAQQLPEPSVKGAFKSKEFRNPEAETGKSKVVTTSLGTQTIGGVSAQGTRYTRTIPVGEIGNTKPIVIVNERWYSPDLQMVVMTKRSDPRSGDTTFQMTDIQRGEPTASLFQVPGDYTISQGPPPHGVATFHLAGPPPPPEQ
jgi:outer membrane lipoprotein-sorting protein